MKKIIILFSLFLITKISVSQCTDLFFSEYVEGSSNNKLIEIYNPTSTTIDLSLYKVFRHNAAATLASDSITLAGMLASGDVYVIGNPFGGTTITAVSDTLDDITFYGGDDALTLIKIGVNTIIDKIGETNGVDPGVNWTVGSGATSEYTLIRKIGINQGNTNWAVAATEWDVYPVDMLDSIGSHTMTDCRASEVKSLDLSSSISAYPNPTQNNINLTINENINDFKMSLYNSVGKLLYSKNVIGNNNLEVNLPTEKGFYFIKIETNSGKTGTVKIVKE